MLPVITRNSMFCITWCFRHRYATYIICQCFSIPVRTNTTIRFPLSSYAKVYHDDRKAATKKLQNVSLKHQPIGKHQFVNRQLQGHSHQSISDRLFAMALNRVNPGASAWNCYQYHSIKSGFSRKTLKTSAMVLISTEVRQKNSLKWSRAWNSVASSFFGGGGIPHVLGDFLSAPLNFAYEGHQLVKYGHKCAQESGITYRHRYLTALLACLESVCLT